MSIPNAEAALIAPEKMRDYLLNPQHRRGSSKARLLLSMGYRQDDWPRLESDLRTQHLTMNAAETEQTAYGVQYVIVAELTGPSGRTVLFRSIWQTDIGATSPRLITMYRSLDMPFPLFEDVILIADHPEFDLRSGDVGTVVDRHVLAGRVDGYSVEFFDMTGQTIAVPTLPENELRLPSQNDRPAVRVLTTT